MTMFSFWRENKQFYHLLRSALGQPNAQTTLELENLLKIYRIRLLNLFKHSPKNASDRLKVQAGCRDGIKLEHREKPLILHQQHIDEAFALSDLFDLNETASISLILSAHQEVINFSDLSRSQCAIYLFYKNRWYLAEALKLLVMNRNGVSWRFDDRPDSFNSAISAFTEQLWRDGLMPNILDFLPKFDLSKEIDKLQRSECKPIENPKLKKMLTETIVDIYVSTSDVLFHWICQTPFNLDEFSALMRSVRNISFLKDDQSSPIHRLQASVVMTALQAIDVNLLENVVRSEDDIALCVPFATDLRMLNAYHQEICGRWADPQLEGVFLLFWSTSLRVLTQNPFTQELIKDFEEDEEEIMDRALETKPFHWLRRRLLTVDAFSSEEFFQRRIDSFLTQLIVYFSIKLKEWRSRAEEECRILKELESLPPPIHFEQFMYFIGDFYKSGVNSDVTLKLAKNYFRSLDSFADQSFSNSGQTQIRLYKFVCESGESLPPLLYVAYLHMLSGLCQDDESAARCFAMLKSFSTSNIRLTNVSLDHFFAALSQYYRTLRSEMAISSIHHSAVTSANIAPDELRGLQSWLNSAKSRISFCDEQRWSCLSTMFGLLACAVPLELKGLLYKCLASFARSEELVQILFDGLVASGVIYFTADGKLCGIQQELDEIESRNEVYPATTGFVEFLAELLSHKNSSNFDSVAFRPCFAFLTDSVLVQFQNRTYKNPAEKWTLAEYLSKVLFNLVDSFDVASTTVNAQSPGCQMMMTLICDGPAFRTIVGIVERSVDVFDQCSDFPGKKQLEETTLFILKSISVVLDKEQLFLSYLHDTNTSVLTSSMDLLLQTMNPRSREPDYLTKITCYLSFHDALGEHCLNVVRILSTLYRRSVTLRTKLLKYFCINPTVSSRILNGFASCLNVDEINAQILDNSFPQIDEEPLSCFKAKISLELLEFLIDAIRSNVSHTPDVVHFILGYDIKKPVDTILQNPGINRTPKTCLHGMLSIVESFCGQSLQSLSFGVLIEPSFRLLYWLSSHRLTSDPTLRYLRGNNEFVLRQLSSFRLSKTDLETNVIRQEILGWLLKLAALDLISSTKLNHRSNISRLLKFLYSEGLPLDMDYMDDELNSSFNISSSIFGIATTAVSTSVASGTTKPKVLEMLNFFDFTSSLDTSAPKLEFFDGARLSQVVAACTDETSKRYPQCNVARLHELLRSEVRSAQGSGFSGQLTLLHQEIENVVGSLAQYNEIQRLSYVRRHAFDGWRQLIEVSFITCSMDFLNVEDCIQLIAQILCEVLDLDLVGQSRDVMSVVLTLSTSLRQQFLNVISPNDVDVSIRDKTNGARENSRYISMLDATNMRSANYEQFDEFRHLSLVANAFRMLLDFMLKAENKRSPQTRALSYGSLMNFIRLAMKPIDDLTQDCSSVQYPSVRERMIDEHRNLLKTYNAEIVELLAKDAFDGPEVCRVLARSCLFTILSLTPNDDSILSVLVSRGYTEYQVATLITEGDPTLEKFFAHKQTGVVN